MNILLITLFVCPSIVTVVLNIKKNLLLHWFLMVKYQWQIYHKQLYNESFGSALQVHPTTSSPTIPPRPHHHIWPQRRANLVICKILQSCKVYTCACNSPVFQIINIEKVLHQGQGFWQIWVVSRVFWSMLDQILQRHTVFLDSGDGFVQEVLQWHGLTLVLAWKVKYWCKILNPVNVC